MAVTHHSTDINLAQIAGSSPIGCAPAAIADRLAEFTAATALTADQNDPTIDVFRQRNAALARVNDTGLSDKASCDAYAARERADDLVMDGLVPVSLIGGVAFLEWAIAEFEELHADEDGMRDKGDRLMLALLNGALGVLRRQAMRETTVAVGLNASPAASSQVAA